jgi:hypothetical protein
MMSICMQNFNAHVQIFIEKYFNLTSCNFVPFIIDQNMIRSISLYKSTLEDSSKIYIAFFCVVFHFLAIFESLSYFSEISNLINKNEKKIAAQSWAAIRPKAT